MLKPVSPVTGYPKPSDEPISSPVVGRRSKFSAANLLIVAIVLFLTGCSSNNREIFTQQELQQLVNSGFLSPQIRQLDMSPIMMQLYLQTPQLFLQGDSTSLMFQIRGEVDAELFGGIVTEKLPLEVSGFAQLRYAPQDQAIFFTNIDHMEATVDLQVALFKTIIEEGFQQALLKELTDIPVISLDKTPKLESALADLVKGQPSATIRFNVHNSQLVVDAEPTAHDS